MLEPPRETPRAIAEAIDTDDHRAAKAIARAGMLAVAGALAFMPLLWWLAPAGSPYPLVLTALIVADGGIALVAARAKVPVPGLVAIANTLIVTTLARMVSP